MVSILLNMPNEIIINIIKFLSDLRAIKRTNKRLYELSTQIIFDFKKKFLTNCSCEFFIQTCLFNNDLFSLQFIYYNIDNKIPSNVISKSLVVKNDNIYNWFVSNTTIHNIESTIIYLIVTNEIDKVRYLFNKQFYNDYKKIKKIIKWAIRSMKYDKFSKIFCDFYKNSEFINFILEFSIKIKKSKYFKNLMQYSQSYEKISDCAINYDNYNVLKILFESNKIDFNIDLLKKCISLNKIACQQIIVRELNITTEYMISLYNK